MATAVAILFAPHQLELEMEGHKTKTKENLEGIKLGGLGLLV